MAGVGRRAFTGVTLPVLGVGVASVKAFADFDGAMTESLAIMGDVSDSMRREMADAAREMAKTTTFSAEQAAESYFFLASAGLDAKQSLEALPTVAQFAQAGMFDMARATDLLTDAQSAMGLSSKDAAKNVLQMARVSDVLARAGTLANATVEQFSEAVIGAAPSARSLGVGLEELTAVMAALASRGIKGAEAGTALAFTLPQLTAAARDNQRAWGDLGLAVFDSTGSFVGIPNLVRQVEDATRGMSDAQLDATLSTLGLDGRMGRTIKNLVGASDEIMAYQAALMEAGGTTKEVADKQLTSLSAQLSLAKSRIIDVGIQLGGTLAPFALAAAEKLAGLVEAFQGLSPQTQKFIIVSAGVAAALGPLLIMFGMMAQGVAGMILLYGKLGAAATILKTKFIALRAAGLSALVGPVGLVLLALTALAALFVFAWRNSEQFREAVRGLMATAMAAFSGIRQAVAPLIPVIKELLVQVGEALAPLLSFLAQMWAEQAKAMVPVISTIAGFLVPAIQILAKALGVVLPIIVNLIKLAFIPFKAMLQLLSGDVEGFKDTVVEGFTILKDTGLLIWDAIKGGIKSRWQATKDFVVGAARGLADFFMRWSLVGIIISKWDAIKEGLRDAWDKIKNVFKAAWITFKNIGRDIMLGMAKGLLSGTDRVKDAAKSAWKGIKDGVKGFFGISSPSKLMAGFGTNIMQGLQMGLEQMKVKASPNVTFDAQVQAPGGMFAPQAGAQGPPLTINLEQHFHGVQDLDEERLLDLASKRLQLDLGRLLRRSSPV